MKTLKNIALAAVILTAAVSAQAEWVSGHFRSNGTYVNSYYRTPANGTPYDNLSYRGYPSQQPGYVSPRSYSPRTLPYTGNYSAKPLYRRSSSFGF
jgi:hypothetical protein